jgi:hypothetical protein
MPSSVAVDSSTGVGEGEGVISCASEERRVARRRKMERSVMGRGTIRARGG